jgi:hypothetical protein
LPSRITNKKTAARNKIPVIKCSSCGAEIMLVQNVKFVSEAIEAHVEFHRLKVRNPLQVEAEAERIRGDLITQAFKTASEQ